MANLTVIAKIVAKKDKVELVKLELLKLVNSAVNEQGCIDYKLHQDNTKPEHFIFYETWESKNDLSKHLSSVGVVNYAQATNGAIDEFTITEMTKLA